ncbi:MAG TPA: choice-of-anchor tandem repeat NxxGxxAF-containing protein [Acidobacteriota bacterium]|jgi:hypothetical protein
MSSHIGIDRISKRKLEKLTLIVFLLLPSSTMLGQKSSYFRYDNVTACLLRDGSGWRARDFAVVVLNPNRDRKLKVILRVSAEPDFLFCPQGPDSCLAGTLSGRLLLDRFGDDVKEIAAGVNSPGFLFPAPAFGMEYDFKGTVEVYSCNDVDPYSKCDPPRTAEEKALRPPFYTQNIPAFTSPEGHDPKPEGAFRNSWQRFDQTMDVFWDKDLQRIIVPFANLYRHISDWRLGWQTQLTVENTSNRDVDLQVTNHLWYGTHSHAPRCEANHERTLSGSFRIGANSARLIDPYREISSHQNADPGQAFVLAQSDDLPWEHDSSLSIKVCPDSADAACFETLQRDLKVSARVFPNEQNKQLCMKPQDLVQQMSKSYLKREATEAEVNFWLAEIYDNRKTAAEIESTIARRGSPYPAKRTSLSKKSAGQPRKDRALSQTSAGLFSFAVVAAAGDPAPGTNGGTFSNFLLQPHLNDNGQVAFSAATGSSPGGIFLFSQGSTTPIVLADQVFSGNWKFRNFSDLAINKRGDIAFVSWISDGSILKNGVFLFSKGETTPVVLSGQQMTDGSVFSSATNLDLSNSGSIAFASSDGKIYLASGGSITVVATPPTVGFIDAYDRPSMNNIEIAYVNEYNAFRATKSDAGISLYSGGTNKTIFSGGGMLTPDINDNGTVVFQGCQDLCGLYRFDGNQPVLLVPSSGKIFGAPQVNNLGQIAYAEGTSYNSEGMLSTLSVYSSGTVIQIGNVEAPGPAGNRFTGYGGPSLNNAGALAFIASTFVEGTGIRGKQIVLAAPLRARRRP